MNMFPWHFPGNEHGPRGIFEREFRAYSVLMFPGVERDDVDKGGKIIMPSSVLDTLTRMHIEYPMLFKLHNEQSTRVTHCGVLEFTAEEGKIFLPHWMMRNLLIEEGGFLKVTNVSLSVAKYSKFQPLSPDFLDISNPKAVLENSLRNFACLTTGDVIAIKYNDRIYELAILDVQPGNAVSIIECDMNVEFQAPVGYIPPEGRQEEKSDQPKQSELEEHQLPPGMISKAFPGVGSRLDGKNDRPGTKLVVPINASDIPIGIPNWDWKFGRINFIRHYRKEVEPTDDSNGDEQKFKAFEGGGRKLREKKMR